MLLLTLSTLFYSIYSLVGKLTVIVGRNGSGKTSLLAAILREMRLISGELVWHKWVYGFCMVHLELSVIYMHIFACEYFSYANAVFSHITW